MYAVYDNGRPAKFPECKVDPSWNNNLFPTYREAVEYANNWLNGWGHVPLEPADPEQKLFKVEYGMGDILYIQKVQVPRVDTFNKWGTLRDPSKVFKKFGRFKYTCLKLLEGDEFVPIVYAYEDENMQLLFYMHIFAGWTWFVKLNENFNKGDVDSKLSQLELELLTHKKLSIAIDSAVSASFNTVKGFIVAGSSPIKANIYKISSDLMLLGPNGVQFLTYRRRLAYGNVYIEENPNV